MLRLRNTIYLKVITSLAILTFIALKVDWGEIVPSFLDASGTAIFTAFALLTLQTLFLGMRWHLIVNTGRKRMSFTKSIQITFASLIANFLFLTSISGLAVRIALTVQQKVSLLFSVGASLIDRLMTVLGLLILAAIFMPFSHAYIGTEIVVMAGSLFATMLMLSLGVFALSKTKYGSFFKSSRKTAVTLKYMRDIFTRPKLFASTIFISLIAQLSYFGAIYILSQGMDLNLSFIQLLTILPMIAIVSALPIGIGGWGIREGAFIYGLGLLGVGLEQAFLISIQIGLIGLISATVIGLPTWFIQDHKK